MHNFSGNQLRKGRFSATGNIYRLTTVTHQRTELFTDWRVGRLVVQQFRCAQQRGLVQSLAWVVMPDHFHWLVSLEHGSLSDLVSRVKSRSSHSITKPSGQAGPVWQRGYHDRALRRDEDLQAAARYVVANPLRAGLADRLGDYPLWDAVWL
ncbi:REP-associated tyrosine transposase [Pseudomonas huanghezhanensis]|uniref:REP-associated tyrosine transposase n=1 Tax=Pseudomonas huanghezhanensis TaxID=3002903 RepID=UPI0022865794|nr:transposase [Pseudomonas sp. BSw22131]